MELSLAMLSMGRLNTLSKSLKSYKENGLLDIVDEKIIYFNGITNEDKRIAKEYGFTILGSGNNIGIGKALIKLFQLSSSKYVIFLENDWELIENADVTKDIIKTSKTLLNNGEVNYILYRHKKNPGHPFAVQKVIKAFTKSNGVLTKKIKSIWKIKRKTCYCHWFGDSINLENLNTIIKPLKGYVDWYFTTNKYCSYTNNPYMCNRKWWLDNIKKQNNVGGKKSEVNVQNHFHYKMDFNIGLNNGLFKHQ